MLSELISVMGTYGCVNFFIVIKKLIAKSPRCSLFYLVMPKTAVTQQHIHKIVTSQPVVLCVKCEVHRCDCFQF